MVKEEGGERGKATQEQPRVAQPIGRQSFLLDREFFFVAQRQERMHR